jgi:hypothetical protein
MVLALRKSRLARKKVKASLHSGPSLAAELKIYSISTNENECSLFSMFVSNTNMLGKGLQCPTSHLYSNNTTDIVGGFCKENHGMF